MALGANALYCSGQGIFSATSGQALSHPKGLSGPSAKAGGPKESISRTRHEWLRCGFWWLISEHREAGIPVAANRCEDWRLISSRFFFPRLPRVDRLSIHG
jgi:hypothetical protein